MTIKQSQKSTPARGKCVQEHNPITWFAALEVYLGYAVLIVFGHMRDFFGRLSGISRYLDAVPPKGYAPLLASWENFYTRRLYHRIQDAFQRPVVGSPGARIDVAERISTDGNRTLTYLKDKSRNCINLGSYNYLGFADDWMSTCSKYVLPILTQFNPSCCSSSMDAGTTAVHRELEETVAAFLGKPAAVIFNMGYNTNATAIPALMGKGCLLISDSLNHASIVNGSRASGARIQVFKHNDVNHLEEVLRREISNGQPRTHRPWRKIMVIVEGIYSMEGETCNLRGIVDVAKKYKAYLFVDEAHSIGALGKTGRGICEHTGVDPSEVDILMGTFTKSFGGMGGYIAASEEIITFLRARCSGLVMGDAMSPVVCQQILTVFKILEGKDGSDIGKRKIEALCNNSNYFREKLIEMGLDVLGDRDSPVVPVMLYHAPKISAFSRECLARNLAVVVVGFPATPLLLSRVRFCVSAAHTIDDLNKALESLEEVAKKCHIRYRTHLLG